jgi:hypothetical protein
MAPTKAPSETGSDDRPWIRLLVVLLLRVGLGINLLNAGLLAYTRMRPGTLGASYAFLLPYFQISAGLALLLGIYTTTAAILAGILVLIPPLLQTIALLSGGYPPFARAPLAAQALVESGMASNLLLVTAVLWFSETGRNAWSLDGLLFGASPARLEARGGPGKSDAQDRRGPELIATCAESRDPGSTA